MFDRDLPTMGYNTLDNSTTSPAVAISSYNIPEIRALAAKHVMISSGTMLSKIHYRSMENLLELLYNQPKTSINASHL